MSAENIIPEINYYDDVDYYDDIIWPFSKFDYQKVMSETRQMPSNYLSWTLKNDLDLIKNQWYISYRW